MGMLAAHAVVILIFVCLLVGSVWRGSCLNTEFHWRLTCEFSTAIGLFKLQRRSSPLLVKFQLFYENNWKIPVSTPVAIYGL